MKLRFVKFFTSRENEIEKKEEGGRRSTAITCSTTSQLARSHSPRFRSPLLSSSFPFFLPPPSPTSPHPPPPGLSAATDRESNALQLSPPPAVPLLPSFFIKSPKQKSVAVVTWRSTLPADPAVTGGRPARRTLAPSSNRMAAASLRFQWHPLCGDWSHRKTKYENELSCFITFIDE